MTNKQETNYSETTKTVTKETFENLEKGQLDIMAELINDTDDTNTDATNTQNLKNQAISFKTEMPHRCGPGEKDVEELNSFVGKAKKKTCVAF